MRKVTSGGSTGRAASSVIAVVILVAIVVILASTAATFFLSSSTRLQSDGPDVVFKSTYDDSSDGNGQYLNVTLKSGERIDTAKLTLRVSDGKCRKKSNPSNVKPVQVADQTLFSTQAGSGITASETITIDKRAFETTSGAPIAADEYLDLSDATVRIVWAARDGAGRTIFTWEHTE